jgi:hypothetical protein
MVINRGGGSLSSPSGMEPMAMNIIRPLLDRIRNANKPDFVKSLTPVFAVFSAPCLAAGLLGLSYSYMIEEESPIRALQGRQVCVVLLLSGMIMLIASVGLWRKHQYGWWALNSFVYLWTYVMIFMCSPHAVGLRNPNPQSEVPTAVPLLFLVGLVYLFSVFNKKEIRDWLSIGRGKTRSAVVVFLLVWMTSGIAYLM